MSSSIGRGERVVSGIGAFIWSCTAYRPPRGPELSMETRCRPLRVGTGPAGSSISSTAVWDPKSRSEEHTSELQVTNAQLVCRLLLEKKKKRRDKATLLDM